MTECYCYELEMGDRFCLHPDPKAIKYILIGIRSEYIVAEAFWQIEVVLPKEERVYKLSEE